MLTYHFPYMPDITCFDRTLPTGLSLLLASASPRRRELLSGMGIPFSVLPADADESIPAGISPRRAVGLLAVRKAYAVLPLLEKPSDKTLILASDTIVDDQGRALGKPRDKQDAFDTLVAMSGRHHEVHTGCALLLGDRLYAAVTTSRILMRPYSKSEVQTYVDSGECMGKAGSYAIQGLGGRLVEYCEGMLDNVIGLPTATVADLFRQAIDDYEKM